MTVPWGAPTVSWLIGWPPLSCSRVPAASPVARAIERDASREGLRIWGLAIGLALVGFLVAYQFVGPAPPRSIVLATGASDGAYHAFGQRYAAFLADYGIDVEVRVTAGSVENAELLASGEADVAFVQGGTVAADDGNVEHMLVGYLIDPGGTVARRYLGSSAGVDEMLGDLRETLEEHDVAATDR